jgi:hypothetical protein
MIITGCVQFNTYRYDINNIFLFLKLILLLELKIYIYDLIFSLHLCVHPGATVPG